MNEKIAMKALELLGFTDYEVTDIYESSFRAIRSNLFMLSELNVELTISDFNRINEDNIYTVASYCIHVLKRYPII